MRNKRIDVGGSLRLRAGLLAWLPIVLVIVAACGKGSGGAAY
jgi:hypothetical protein